MFRLYLLLVTFAFNNCYEVEKLNENLKSLILKKHNILRNQLASGTLEPFPSASKMREVTWDESLEDSTIFSHPFAGHNNGFNSTNFDMGMEDSLLIEKTIDSWFDEYKEVPVTEIDNFDRRFETGEQFTVMARENNHKIGCTFIKYPYDKKNRNLFRKALSCYYNKDNAIGDFVYTRGESCSECSHFGVLCSSKFTNLCSADREITIEEKEIEEVKENKIDEPISVKFVNRTGDGEIKIVTNNNVTDKGVMSFVLKNVNSTKVNETLKGNSIDLKEKAFSNGKAHFINFCGFIVFVSLNILYAYYVM